MQRISQILIIFTTVILMTGCSGDESKEPDTKPEVGSIKLTSLSKREEGTQFIRLDAKRTGIDFIHQWTPPPEFEHDIMVGSAGGGVCIGDYDGDERPDVFLTRPFGGCRLYRNLGDFRFKDVTFTAGVDEEMWGAGPTFADIDNDGDLDLLVCGHRCPMRVYINQGDGTFINRAKELGLNFNGAGVMIAPADYDLDGDLDLYLVTNRITPQKPVTGSFVMRDGRQEIPSHLLEQVDVIHRPGKSPFVIMSGQYDQLYRNDGDGSFTNVTLSSGIQGNEVGLAAVWWDYDDDGLPDLYVSNDLFGTDRLYHNDGNGKFTDVIQETLPHTPWFSMGSDVADVDGDGRIDLLATDMAATTHYRQKLSMGEMGSNTWFLEQAEPRQYMRNALYLNTGTPRFKEVAFLTGLANTDWTWAVKFADLDNDGRVDLFVTNGMTRDWMHSDLLKKAAGPVESRIKALREVWLKTPKLKSPNLAFRNFGDLRFGKVGPSWGLDQMGISFGAAMGDLDGDGDLDIVVNNFDEPVSIFRNQVAKGHGITIRLVGKTSNRWGIGATARIESAGKAQIRYLTLSRGFMSANEPLIHFGLDDAQKIDKLTIDWPSGTRQTFTELAVDQRYTITEPAAASPRPAPLETKPMFVSEKLLSNVAHKEKPYNDFARQPLLPNKLSQLGPGMAWSDVDGDGDDDLLLGGAAGSPTQLYRNDNGRFYYMGAYPWMSDRDCEDMAPLFFDADGDGDLDLYVVSGGVECKPNEAVLRDRLYLNDGAGNYSRAPAETLPDTRDSGSVVVACDFDHDGDLDLFVGGRVIPGKYPLSPRSRLLKNNQGKFVDVTEKLAPEIAQTGMVTSAIWSDVDADGWLDLLVTHEWGPVKLFRNLKGKLVDHTSAAGLAKRTGWFNGIAARDVDGDSDIDYVVTNFGLNTKYHASQTKPTQLYYGDFEQDGRMRLVEAEFENDILYPVRGKSCSTRAMPSLGKKFNTFEAFAGAELGQIYSKKCLTEAHRFEATTLQSGLLINDGKGHFKFRPLPRLAQVAPAFGVVITEVNGDNWPDIYLAQNFFSPQSETGRMDGGLSLLLLGSEGGKLRPIGPAESGLLVSGDAKSLVRTDLNGDGWPDFVLGVNNNKLVAFRNSGSSSRRTITIRLKGTVGNPTGVGSRVTVTLEDGTTQTAEVYAGGGYLSQSNGTLIFGIGKDKSPKAIEIVWPDGKVTRKNQPTPQSNYTFEAPTKGVQ